MIRVLIIDDHALVRDGLRRVFELLPDLRVVAEAATGAEAFAALERHTVDVATVDLSLPDIGGIELVRRLREKEPCLRIVVLSMYPEDQLASHLFELGAMAYLSKSRSSDEVIDAIRRVHAGERVYPPTVDPRREGYRATPPTQPHEHLTAREFQVFIALVEGLSPSEVAHRLEVSPSTVSNHLAAVRSKLGVETNGEILRYASRVGLI